MPLRIEDVDEGTELPGRTINVTRADLVRYAGASDDYNPLHWNSRVAGEAGLPDVIAHGMLTMGLAAGVVTGWVGDPGAIIEYHARFSKPVVVPDDEHGASLEVHGRIGAKLDDTRVRVDLVVTSGDTKVLSEAHAIVRVT
ncbi:MaoC family dehydratase [Streptomyces bobili]|uniref:MaoC family dehydratase n=1 Tax=Streptomyces bobili TaxID=67280 RepID=UPI0034161538